MSSPSPSVWVGTTLYYSISAPFHSKARFRFSIFYSFRYHIRNIHSSVIPDVTIPAETPVGFLQPSCKLPPFRLSTVGKRAFPVSGANFWNSLPWVRDICTIARDIRTASWNISLLPRISGPDHRTHRCKKNVENVIKTFKNVPRIKKSLQTLNKKR